jgi:hypothetical protein
MLGAAREQPASGLDIGGVVFGRGTEEATLHYWRTRLPAPATDMSAKKSIT